MKLVKIGINLLTEDRAKAFDWRAGLLKSIVGDQPEFATPNQPFLNEGVSVEIGNKKARLDLKANNASLVLDTSTDGLNPEDFINDIFGRIIQNTGWAKSQRIGLRTIWVEKTDMPFLELVKKIKNKNFVQNSITNEAVDIALSFTLKDEKNGINYNAGAMTNSEILQRFQVNLNENDAVGFLAVDLDYFSATPESLNIDSLKAFLKKGMEYGKVKAEETKKTIV